MYKKDIVSDNKEKIMKNMNILVLQMRVLVLISVYWFEKTSRYILCDPTPLQQLTGGLQIKYIPDLKR